MGPPGADNDIIKPATTHIIPAIRRLYAQSGPKVTPKWNQRAPKVTLICQKLSQSDPKATPTEPQSFIKSLSGSNSSVSPLWRTRRGETERPLSESGLNKSFYKNDGPWALGHGLRALGPGPWGPSNRHIRQAIDKLDKFLSPGLRVMSLEFRVLSPEF